MPISMTQGSNKYYLHYDQVGSLRAVTDSNHNIVKEVIYDSFGNILSDSNESFSVPFGFAGGLYDSDTKLSRFGYRDYDSYTGKWTAKDPIDFSGGDTNLYGYVLNDPVNFVDVDGEFAVPIVIIGEVVVVGGFFVYALDYWRENIYPRIMDWWNNDPCDNVYNSNSDYTGHGDNPEGKTGKKSSWNKHSIFTPYYLFYWYIL